MVQSGVVLVLLLAYYASVVHSDESFVDGEKNNLNGWEDTLGWTNINNEVDIALLVIYPIMVARGYTMFNLPNMTENLSVKPLFISYPVSLRLTNGLLYNIHGISRSGDSMMTYHNKSFHFRANLIVSHVEFSYDFDLHIIAVYGRGTINGLITDTLVTGDFSIGVQDAEIQLNDFRILSIGNIELELKYNSIIKHLSGSILRPITNLFQNRISTTLSDAIRNQLEVLIGEINQQDRLQLKEFARNALSGLVG